MSKTYHTHTKPACRMVAKEMNARVHTFADDPRPSTSRMWTMGITHSCLLLYSLFVRTAIPWPLDQRRPRPHRHRAGGLCGRGPGLPPFALFGTSNQIQPRGCIVVATGPPSVFQASPTGWGGVQVCVGGGRERGGVRGMMCVWVCHISKNSRVIGVAQEPI
jgi:hypothetical protein